METLDRTTVTNFVKVFLKADLPRGPQEHDGETFYVIRANDVVITLADKAGKKTFAGLTFECAGTQFFITDDYCLSILVDEEESFIVEDSKMLKAMSSYLNWRGKLLLDMSI